jgi:hypothetical protein
MAIRHDPLSTQGLDLTRTEFLEVYVAAGSDVRLVLDLGTVSEDALFIDANGNTSGTRADGRPWGLGILDQEADPARGELWNDAADALGVWGETCTAERGRIYRIGDPRSVCTRGNGRPDSEDLDGDGILDTQERHLRYVVLLDGSSPYLARSAAETGTDFQLYRIPIRGVGAIEVGGAVGDADLRSVRHLRITASGPGGAGTCSWRGCASSGRAGSSGAAKGSSPASEATPSGWVAGWRFRRSPG